jgi:HlyD family secretion protein
MKLLNTQSLVRRTALMLAVLTPLACSGEDSIDPNTDVTVEHDFTATQTVAVSTLTIPVWYEAVGSVEAAETIDVAPQLDGRILEMAVEVGAKVKAGDVLFRLDDRNLKARVAQAQAGVSAAGAVSDQANAALERVNRLFKQEAATAEQQEAAIAAASQAEAGVAQAQQAVLEAQTFLSYAIVQSPVDGVVAERLAEAGDLALPGQVALRIYGGVEMDFVAAIRESKIEGVEVGSEVQVDFPTPGLRVAAVVHELRPAADPATRSFTIKASLPLMKLLRPGMYGKLMLQTGELQVTVIPMAAVSRVGQLETVMVKSDGAWQRRFVRTGSELESDFIEILSGLSDGETIGWTP